MDGPPDRNVDPTLLELFRAELDAHIPILNDGLLALEKGPSEEREIAAMMRAAHSIKGAARIVGVDAAVRLAHAMEDCFNAAKEDHIPLPSAAVDVLLKAVDALHQICATPTSAEPDRAWLDSLLEQLAAIRAGRAPTPTPVKPASAADSLLLADLRVNLPAELDDSAASALCVQLCEAVQRGTFRFALDFTRVERVSASAMAVLACLARMASGLSPTPAVSVYGVTAPMASLLRVSGLDRAWSANG